MSPSYFKYPVTSLGSGTEFKLLSKAPGICLTHSRFDRLQTPSCPQSKLQASTRQAFPFLGSQESVLPGLLLALILRATFQDSTHFLHTLDHMTFIPITLGMSRDCLAHVLVCYIKPPELGGHQGRNCMDLPSCLRAQHKPGNCVDRNDVSRSGCRAPRDHSGCSNERP